MVFDPAGDGVYLGLDIYFASRAQIYHVHDDFSQPPELVMDAIPPEPIIEEAAKILNLLISEEEKLEVYVDLAQEYSDDANARFIVSYESFWQKRMDLFSDYADNAYTLNPSVIEYKLYAGLAAYQKGENERAMNLLEGLDLSDYYPFQSILKLSILEKLWAPIDSQTAIQYHNQRQAILDEYDVHGYYEATILPRLDALDE